jgi:hypothetical protein
LVSLSGTKAAGFLEEKDNYTKNKAGAQQERIEWHRRTAWGDYDP